jgi:UDP-glucuronate decarboxylase
MRAFVARRNDVVCVENFFTGTKTNIAHLLDNRNFEVIRHDVTFPLYVEIDELYNLACPASPIYYQRDPVQTTKTSVHGAINMLGLAKRVLKQKYFKPQRPKFMAIQKFIRKSKLIGGV